MIPNSNTRTRPAHPNSSNSIENHQTQNIFHDNTYSVNSVTDNQSIENHYHPLSIHNNDQPGMVLISKKLLGSENYASWK